MPEFKTISLLECPDIVELIKGRSWKENGPVRLIELSYLKISYLDFNHTFQLGEMIVHNDIASQVLEIFKDLFEVQFPIQSMRLIDHFYQPEERYKPGIENEIDDRSMSANNTTSLFVRKIVGSDQWSNHSTGRAIDINPLINPFVLYKDNSFTEALKVCPIIAGSFVKRDPLQPGMVESIVHIFKKRGFLWGGDWADKDNKKDYQHFSTEPRDI